MEALNRVDNDIITSINTRTYWDEDNSGVAIKRETVQSIGELTALLKLENAVGIKVTNNKVEVLFCD